MKLIIAIIVKIFYSIFTKGKNNKWKQWWKKTKKFNITENSII
jgi:hypothetical protein